jgi:hypothetical protein
VTNFLHRPFTTSSQRSWLETQMIMLYLFPFIAGQARKCLLISSRKLTSASCCCWTSRGLLFPTVIATWNYRVWILEGGSVSCRITQVDGRIWLLIFLDIYSFGYSDILSETCKCWMEEETLKVSKQMKKNTISLGDTSSHLFGTNSSNLDCLT